MPSVRPHPGDGLHAVALDRNRRHRRARGAAPPPLPAWRRRLRPLLAFGFGLPVFTLLLLSVMLLRWGLRSPETFGALTQRLL